MDITCMCFLLAALVTYASSAEDKEEICALFLNDNDIKYQLSSSGVTATACPCFETKLALDYSFKKIDNFYQEWFYDDHGLKQMCCYSGSGKLLTGAPEGGYLLLKSSFENISKAHEACCHGNNRRCKQYYDINPSDDCSRYNKPDKVKSWGDPVITTLDGLQYDFNGHGEYSFLNTGVVEIQARTEYVTMGNVDATMFTSFVIYNSDHGEQIELHFNRSSKIISVYRHGVYLNDSSRYSLSPIAPVERWQCMVIVGGNKVLMIGCGIDTFAKNIQFSADNFMSIEINVKTDKMSVLNFTGLAQPRIDGNLVKRNGSLVNVNASASHMFDFGESWALQTESESRFNYSVSDKNFTSYYSKHTRPRFLEDLVGSLTALFPNATNDTIDKYNKTCRNYWNNEPNKRCLLIIARTGDYNLGVAIMKTENETQLIKEMTHNHRPSFNDDMPSKLKVILTEYSSPYIIDLNNYVNDPDSNEVLRFTVETNIPKSDYELGIRAFKWTIKKSLRNIKTSLDINFHVFDKFNKTASHTMQIDLCGCEHGNSECNFTVENNASGIIAKCICDKAYNGDFCEETVDPCLLNYCYLDHCNHSAAVGEDPCEPCPDGYQGDGRACTDVDECEVSYNGTGKCEQNCTNTEGSFICDCLSTYKLNDDNYTCSAEDKEPNCTLFLNDNDIKHQLTLSGVRATACPCDETEISLDYSFKKMDNCYQEWFYNNHGSKQMCCYSESGNLLTGAPAGGYLSLKSYSESISIAQKACCHENISRCKMYYAINPSDNCSRYNQPDIVKSWGDPMITTLDGLQYDFNGHGEYLFLKTGVVEIQARTEYVTMGNVDATMFTSFVIYNSTDGEQIELHFNRSSKIISVYRHGVYLNDSSISTPSPITPVGRRQCMVIVGGKKVLTMGCGIDTFAKKIQFSAENFMSIEINVKTDKMSELNFTGLAQPRIDGNLVKRNGSLVNENASASHMFDFGESWALQNESESHFNYSITDKNFTSYNSDHTRPRFLEDLVGNLTALFPNATDTNIDEYNETCRNYWNNEPNKQCLLTIARTGDYNLGVAIMKKENETQLIKEMTNNHRPSFNDDMLNKLKVILTEYNSPYIIDLNKHVNDSDSHEVFRFTVETDIPKSDYELGNGEFKWTIKKSLRNMNTSLDINFHVFDKFNKTASHTMQIDLCGCEHGNSECDFTVENNASGIIAKCNCDKAYKGDFCEETVDPCLLNSCYLGHCNHLAAVGEDPCEPCPDGYQGDGRACTDVDECEVSYNGTDKCEQNCTNTEGSFTCDCLSTYKLNADNYTCSDIDECTNGSLICSNGTELCVNTIGSAHCACVPGYIRKASNGSCESVKGTLQYAGYMNFTVTTTIKISTSSEVNTIENREAINVEMDKWYKGTNNYVAVEVYLLQVLNSSRRRRAAGSESTKLEVDFILYGSNGSTHDIGAAIEQSYKHYKNGHRDIAAAITVAGMQVSLHPDAVSMRSPNEFGMCNMTDRTDCDTTTTVCKNTDGGFECQCLSGYTKNSNSSNKCFDIDECTVFNANSTLAQRCVQGICKNEVGTWTCDCPSDLERQSFGDASYLVYRCQGNYSYIGNASLTVRGIANDTDIINTIERYVTNSYRNQSLEGKTFTVAISNMFVSTTVLTLENEKNFTNGTMPFTAVFKLRMGRVVEVQRVADVLSKVVRANATITGNSFNASIVTAHIYTDEENMLCTLSNNSDCDLSSTRCQQSNGSTSCQCLDGYERKNNKSCTVKDCGSPSKPDNGWVKLTNNQTIFNSTATFECNEGYYLDGDNGSECTSAGHWSSNASCSIRDCGTLKVENGEATLVDNGTTFNHSAAIQCHIGYDIIGNTRSVCNASGHWTVDSICKLADCGNLTNPLNGSVETEGNLTTYQSTANFSCSEGFYLIGEEFSSCASDGNWTSIPKCEIYDCGPLEISNGTVKLDGNRTTYSTKASISCETGFDLFGDSQIVCDATGNWSGEANCTIKDCGVLSNPVNGSVTIVNNVTTYNSVAYFSCDKGYHLDGGDEISICESNGNWSMEPTCILHDCGNLTIQENGTVYLTNNLTTFNSSATFSCDLGYKLTTDNYSECNSSGQWTNTPQCKIRDCGKPLVENGTFSLGIQNDTTFGSTANVTCDEGFTILGNVSTTCDSQGVWTSLPTCEIKDCRNPKKPVNGSVEIRGNITTYQSTATFSCDMGFYLGGEGVSTCESDGNWTSIPTCDIYDCGNITTPANGNVSLSNRTTTYGSQAIFTCDEGYTLINDTLSICNSNGQWTNTPLCQIIDCQGLSEPQNGHVFLDNDTTTYGSVATYECLPGYFLSGSNTTHCNASGNWSDIPICNIKDCGKLTMKDHGTVFLTNNLTTFNSSATFSCVLGYELTTYNYSECNSSGQWTNKPKCEIRDCGNITTPANGNVSLSNRTTTYGSQAIFTCDEGYTLINDTLSICNSNGQWTNTPLCQIIDCQGLSEPQNGHVFLDNDTTTYGSVATYECLPGYFLSGSNTTHCNASGNWSDIPICNIKDCGKLTMKDHGTVFLTNNLTTFNSSATFSCVLGYELTTYNYSECNSSGQWTNKPKCEIRDCGNITAPANGNVSLSNSMTSYGSQANFMCDEGYQLTNETPSVCNSSGQWTHTPSCQIIDCPQLHEPQHGHVYQINDTRTYGSMARYECSRGYLLSGSTITLCESSGNWSDIPKCNIKDCGFWSNNTTNRKNNIAVNYENNQTYGSTATAECIPGYHVNGSIKTKSVAVCQHDAKWSASVPMCVQTECHDINVTDSNLNHGKVSKPYPVNTTIRFTCPDGYNIKGFQNLTCLSSSQWSHDAPTCVKVAAGVPNCEKKGEWESAKPGTTLMMNICSDDYEGSITRQCSEKGEWMQPINRCVHKNIIQMKDTVESLPDKISDPLKVTDVLLKLENISNQDQSGNSASTIQDFTELTSTLSSLVTKSGGLNVSDAQSKPFLDSTSNLLDVLCSISCGKDKSSPEESSERETEATSQLLETVNRYTNVVARSLNKTNNNVTISAKNLVMHVRRIKETDEEVIFPTKEDRVNVTSSVSIPHASLNSLTDGNISVVIYDNLNTILSTSAVQNGTKYTGINSQVMAVDIKGWQKNPEFKLNMTFNHFDQTSETAGIPHCSFFTDKDSSRWNTTGCTLVKSASNSNTSVCECEHLTNFAILMSPWIPPSDAEALDIISIIGCSLSLLGLLVTMIMHLTLWRYLKSDRVVILMNLCLALSISYAIFLGGVDQTQNKDACTVVAVLLQYIYLVVFFLMLAEAIELAVTVLYVFSTSSRLKWLVPLAWFLPAMITGVSVGSSQLEGYGNEQFCWLSIEDGLIWAFVAPAFTIIIINFVLLVLVMKAMFNAQTLAQKSLSQRTKTGVRCLCVLLPLMGITWAIGIFYVNEETVWIQYVFAVCNSLQGLVIFIFHCALNTQIRRAVRRKHKQYTDSMQISKSSTFSMPRAGIRNSKHNTVYNYMTEIEPDYDYDWRISAYERNSSKSRESYGEWITPKSSAM